MKLKKCPVCEIGELNYGKLTTNTQFASYFFKCKKCKTEGIESYKLVFNNIDILERGKEKK